MRSTLLRGPRVLAALVALVFAALLQGLPEQPTPDATAHACAANVAYGVPQPASGAGVRLLCRDGYALAHSADTRSALFVSQRLAGRRGAPLVARLNEFAPDPALPPLEAAQLSDYRGSGYDRGHLAPAGDFTHSERLMRESFYLSNVVPQDSVLNRGAWAELERHVRQLARERGAVYVITGPVNDTQPARIGAGVAVPRALYKVVIDPRARQAVAWLMPNRADVDARDWDRWRTSVREAEAATGIEFNPALDATEQERLETSRRAL